MRVGVTNQTAGETSGCGRKPKQLPGDALAEPRAPAIIEGGEQTSKIHPGVPRIAITEESLMEPLETAKGVGRSDFARSSVSLGRFARQPVSPFVP